MSPYIEPIKLSLIIFPLTAMMFTFPFAVFEFRKHGSITWRRTLILFSFMYYLCAAYFLVILPLPEANSVHTSAKDMMNLIPFQFVKDIMKAWAFNVSQPKSILKSLLSPAVLQVAFNVLLIFPFGVYLRLYFGKTMKQTLLFSFLLSLFFECTQLSGLYFIYPGPYRLFDVDDLFLNTLGGFLGFISAHGFRPLIPTQEVLYQESISQMEHVSLIKRWVVFIIDIIVIDLLHTVISGLLFAIGLTQLPDLGIRSVVFMTYFMIFQGVAGQTLGERFLHVKCETQSEPRLEYITIRTTLTLIGYYLLLPIFNGLLNHSIMMESRIAILALVLVFVTVFVVYAGSLLIALFSKHPMMWNDRLSRTKLVSTLSSVK